MGNLAPVPHSSSPTVSPLAARLAPLAPLPHADRQAAERLLSVHTRRIRARRDFAREGEAPTAIYVMLEGWAARHKTLADGRRQIVGLMVAGDVCDLDIVMLKRRDHSVCAITDVIVAELPPQALDTLLTSHEPIARAIKAHDLVKASIQHEWILSLGRRTALERIAHLMCEMFFRQQAVGLTDGLSCAFPITQIDLGEATGLTAVHVNRTIQALRGDGLIKLRSRRLTIVDLPALMRVGLFSPDYLHFGGLGGSDDAG